MIFHKKKFLAAIIYFPIDDFIYITSICFEKFGHVQANTEKSYFWNGRKSFVILRKDYQNELGELIIASKKEMKEEKENIGKAINDF